MASAARVDDFIEDLLGRPTLDVDGIPEELREGRAWCCWRYETRAGKATKVPYRADGSSWRSNDATTWHTFEEALAAFDAGRWDGIGRVLDDDLCGVDLDWKHAAPEALGAAGEPPWFGKVLALLASAAEWSPSGQGAHVWLRGAWGGDKRQYALPHGCGVEVYDHASPRFFCVTGNRIDGSPAVIRSGPAAQAALDALANELAKATTPKKPGNGAAHDDGPDLQGAPEGMRRAALTSEAGRLRALGVSRAEATAVLLALASRCTPPVPEDHVDEILTWAWKKPAGGRSCPVCHAPEPCAEHSAAPPQPERGLIGYTLAELRNVTFKPRPGLLYCDSTPVLRNGEILQAFGPRGLGKSLLGGSLALAAVSGGRFLRWHAPEPLRVLLIDGELPGDTIRARLLMLAEAMGVSEEALARLTIVARDWQAGFMPRVDTVEGAAGLQPFLDAGPAIVLLDSRSTLFDPESEQDVTAWSAGQDFLLDLRKRGIASVVTHHANRLGGARGHSRPEDIMDTIIQLSKPEGATASDGCRMRLDFVKNRAFYGDAAAPFTARLADDGWHVDGVETETREAVLRRAILAHVEAHPGCSKGAVVGNVQGREQTVRALIDALVEAGLLTRKDGKLLAQ